MNEQSIKWKKDNYAITHRNQCCNIFYQFLDILSQTRVSFFLTRTVYWATCKWITRLMRSFYSALSVLIAVCVLSPAQLKHVLGFTSFRLRFGGVLRGWFVPRTWFDRVPAGTVLAGTRLFRTHSDYKKWCFRWNCTENKCERPVYVPRGGVWGMRAGALSYTHKIFATHLYWGSWLLLGWGSCWYSCSRISSCLWRRHTWAPWDRGTGTSWGGRSESCSSHCCTLWKHKIM